MYPAQVVNEYEDLFQVELPQEEKSAVDDLNAFMALVLPDINASRMPDIEAAARKTGVDIGTARDMVKMVMEKTGSEFGEGTKPDAALFSKIYLLADEIRLLAPWRRMYETDLFGVKIPGTDRVYFISIMGAEGAFFALSAYKGYPGFPQFFEFHEHADFLPVFCSRNMKPMTLSWSGHL